MARRALVLPDCLAPDLKAWFVGTAAGPWSAAMEAYYAHPGNRFWAALHITKITPRRFAPHEYPLLLELGLGLTDLCKTDWGTDSQIDIGDFDVRALRGKVVRLKPQMLAFTSKKAASLWLGTSTGRIPTGLLSSVSSAGPGVFVLPSPSGIATSYWSINPWRDLARHLRSRA